jgi:signal transduction histidine kinase
VSITVQAPGNDLRVEVTDNGKGISSERIHDP